MDRRYAPGLFDRIIDENPASSSASDSHGWTLEQLKDAVARDLEKLLNTRAAMPESAFTGYPEASTSVLNYGLINFAGMCLSSDVDRKRICAAVQLTIKRHEPRLHAVTASLRTHKTLINRIDFVITAKLRAQSAADLVQFDAVLEPSTQQYSIRKLRASSDFSG